MKISKTHKEFAKRLNKQDVLNRPEIYLGPNWEAVINFWLYLDTLTEEQLKVVGERYVALNKKKRHISISNARVASVTIKYEQDAEIAAYCSVSSTQSVGVKTAAYYATCELLGLDKLLKRGHQPVFFPMFLNPLNQQTNYDFPYLR